MRGNYNNAGMAGTGGPFPVMLDPWLTGVGLSKTAREYVVGHDLAFVYDEEGNAIGHKYARPMTQWVQPGLRDRVNVLEWDHHELDQKVEWAFHIAHQPGLVRHFFIPDRWAMPSLVPCPNSPDAVAAEFP
ncbi:MAG: hypothetical protein AB8G99_01575 [Planctomycetaceae bacterium]